jgi:hypothetical protein
VQTIALEPYDLLRHDRLMISRPAAEKLSRSLAITKKPREEEPVQIEGAAAPKHEAKHEAKHKAKPKAEKAARPAKAAKAKPKAKAKHKAPAKPKGKKG